jgi:hypothetical protein
MNQYTFDDWMLAVDYALVKLTGLESTDLPDWGYWDAWHNGMTPGQAAEKVKAAAVHF